MYRPFVLVGRSEPRENMRHAIGQIRVAFAVCRAKQRMQRRLIPRIMTQSFVNRRAVFRLFRGVRDKPGHVDFDSRFVTSFFEFILELGNARFEILDPTFERRDVRVTFRIGTSKRRTNFISGGNFFANTNLVPRFVRSQERLFEPAQSFRIEAQGRCRPFELDAFVRGDHAIFEHLGKQLLVICFELINLDVTGHFARFERRRMLEDRFLAH